MNIKLFFTPAGIGEDLIIGTTAVVIDILRATSVAAVALSNGAREVIPVAHLGDASSLKQKLDKTSVLLGGEREGQKVEGFDLGNSPFEYNSGVAENKSIILATTNGSAALIKGNDAEYCLSCSFLNASAILNKILQIKNHISIICAGNKGGFSLEDALCGGMMVDKLMESGGKFNPVNDAAIVSRELYLSHKDDIAGALRQSDHGKFLESIGFGKDVEFCASIDELDTVPMLQSGRLVVEE